MFCPRCGTQAIELRSPLVVGGAWIETCKSCGTHLELVKPALVGSIITPPRGAGKWDEKRLAQLRKGIAASFGGIALVVFLYFFFGSLGFAAIGAFPFAAGAAKIINTLFFHSPDAAPRLAEKLKGAPAPPAVNDPVASVTDQTTRHLQNNPEQNR